MPKVISVPGRGRLGNTRLQARKAFTAVAALCLGLAACGGVGGAKTPASVRDFRLIEVGKTRLQIAADGSSAIVQVETNPPTVCAIAYGRTASLGSIADDPDMGGTAITRHRVVLDGLTPGTTYRFLLTATDAQGLVFQTPALTTFTTPRDTAALGQDVAIGAKVVAFSSQWSNAYRATNAVDGKLSTEWASAGDGDRAFITIDLGRQRKITGISFVTRRDVGRLGDHAERSPWSSTAANGTGLSPPATPSTRECCRCRSRAVSFASRSSSRPAGTRERQRSRFSPPAECAGTRQRLDQRTLRTCHEVSRYFDTRSSRPRWQGGHRRPHWRRLSPALAASASWPPVTKPRKICVLISRH